MMIRENKSDIEKARDYGQYIETNFGSGRHQAYVVRFCGARGSGKSLLLALHAVEDLYRGRTVWSNMPVKITPNALKYGLRKAPLSYQRYATTKKAGLLGRHTLPLDWDAFYTLSEDLVEGTVCIDEAQYFSDSRASLSLKNRLLNAIVAQVRKRNLNLYYTVKQSDWIDRRLSYETDIQVNCSDVSISPWGQERGTPRGEMVFANFWDLSGIITGHEANMKDPYAKPYKQGTFQHMHLLWDCYDTTQAVSLEEGFTNVKLDLRQRVISNKESHEQITGALQEVVGQLAAAGTTEIGTADFQNMANSMGIPGTMQYLGKFLRDLGVVRKQKYGGSYVYDLSNLQNGGNGHDGY